MKKSNTKENNGISTERKISLRISKTTNINDLHILHYYLALSPCYYMHILFVFQLTRCTF